MIVRYILILLFISVPSLVFALDNSCIVGDSYDGYRCGVDMDSSGFVEDCSEMLICYRPDGGQCSGSVAAGYTCSSNGNTYSTLTQCQNNCGGTKIFVCPIDVSDPVCNGQAPFVNRTYMELQPGNFDTLSYTFAITDTAYNRDTYKSLCSQYSGHPADRTYKDFILSTFSGSPFWLNEGTLYSDVFFGSPDVHSCYFYESYDGSIWRPRDYCPGYNCSNYNVSTAGGVQRWEKVTSSCGVNSFCQDAYLTICIPTSLTLSYNLWDGASFTWLGDRNYYTGYNSGYFYYDNQYEFYYGPNWYGVTLQCTSGTWKEGYYVCTSYYNRVYGPGYDQSGNFSLSGTCNQYTSHWVGPAYGAYSLYVGDQTLGDTLPPIYKGTMCHYPGQNSGSYSNTQVVNGSTVTTTCRTSTAANMCDQGTINICNTYRQCIGSNCVQFSFDSYCSSTSSNVSNLWGGDVTVYHNPNGTFNYDKITEYRDISGTLKGIAQWDYVKCKPCMLKSSGIIINDPSSGPDVPIDQIKTCMNFKMFSGSDKRCRPMSISTLLLTNCCDLSGWFKSWCNNEERELKKRRQAGSCKEVGTYCSKKVKFIGLCLEKKTSFCCFSSKLSRIINEQGRPQIGKSFGDARNPDCKGFTPDEFSRLDFSSLDLSEYIQEIESKADTSISTQEIGKGVQDWLIQQKNPTYYHKDQ